VTNVPTPKPGDKLIGLITENIIWRVEEITYECNPSGKLTETYHVTVDDQLSFKMGGVKITKERLWHNFDRESFIREKRKETIGGILKYL